MPVMLLLRFADGDCIIAVVDDGDFGPVEDFALKSRGEMGLGVY